MAKYKKKPIVVEISEPYYPENLPWPDGVEKDTFSHEGGRHCPECTNDIERHATIQTLEGKHIVCPGDRIITGVKGEKYLCKPDIFEQTYEKV